MFALILQAFLKYGTCCPSKLQREMTPFQRANYHFHSVWQLVNSCELIVLPTTLAALLPILYTHQLLHRSFLL